jgi:hypothetical protein
MESVGEPNPCGICSPSRPVTPEFPCWSGPLRRARPKDWYHIGTTSSDRRRRCSGEALHLRVFMRGERGDSNPRPPGPQPGARYATAVSAAPGAARSRRFTQARDRPLLTVGVAVARRPPTRGRLSPRALSRSPRSLPGRRLDGARGHRAFERSLIRMSRNETTSCGAPCACKPM